MIGDDCLRYELGDYVKINKRWQKQSYPRIFEGEDDFFKYCDESGHDDGLPITIMKKIEHIEQGFICGVRRGIKVFHCLDWSEGIDVGIGFAGQGFYTHDEIYEDMYLVATRMNCIYRVSKEDIKLLKDSENYLNA